MVYLTREKHIKVLPDFTSVTKLACDRVRQSILFIVYLVCSSSTFLDTVCLFLQKI